MLKLNLFIKKRKMKIDLIYTILTYLTTRLDQHRGREVAIKLSLRHLNCVYK
jgi:hypothetical protein